MGQALGQRVEGRPEEGQTLAPLLLQSRGTDVDIEAPSNAGNHRPVLRHIRELITEKKESAVLTRLRKLYTGRHNLNDKGERTVKSTTKLLRLYASMQGSKWLGIWFWQFLIYYADVALDISMLMVFRKNGDYKFILMSFLGMALATFYSLVEMVRGIQPVDPPRLMLLLGFLLPFQLHVFALCIYSTVFLKGPHPMLLSFKLAESALEATVSSVIQTYSAIFRHLDTHDKMLTYLSICTSYLSIAFAFTQFDHREKGLHMLRGLAERWDLKLVSVFVFRVCEVCSRIVSLGLLQRATRNEMVMNDFSFASYGAATITVIDFIIMFILCCFYQCRRQGSNWQNLLFSTISVVAYINPLLLKQNAFTIPCWLYYSVRVVELAAMGGIAMRSERLHCAHQIAKQLSEGEPAAPICMHHKHAIFRGWTAFRGEFWDDNIPFVAFVASTALMYLLLPLIRCYAADNVLLRDPSMYASHQFSDAEDHLCTELLTGRSKSESFSRGRRLASAAHSDSEEFRSLAQALVDETRRCLARAIKENDPEKPRDGNHTVNLLSVTVSRLMLAHTEDVEEEEDEDVEQEGLDWTPSELMHQPSIGPGKGGLFQALEDWLRSEFQEQEEEEKSQMSVAERFEQVVRVCWNVRKWLKIDDNFDQFALPRAVQRERHRKVLEAMNASLRKFPEVRERLLKPGVADMLLDMLPPFNFLTLNDADVLHQEMLLYREKCELIGGILKEGWGRGDAFLPLAKALKGSIGIPSTVLKDLKDLRGNEFTFLARTQMHVYLNMLLSMPAHMFSKNELLTDEEDGFFRTNREFKDLVEFADEFMEHRNKHIIGWVDGKGHLPWHKKMDLIRSGFNYDAVRQNSQFVFVPRWDAVLETSKAINLFPQIVTIIRLEKVTFQRQGAEPESMVIRDVFDLEEVLTTKEERGLKINFHFARVAEVEKGPLPYEQGELGPYQKEKLWQTHQTLLLHFFRTMHTKKLNRTILDHIAGKLDKETERALAQINSHKGEMEKEILETLAETINLLDAARNSVYPTTSKDPFLEEFVRSERVESEVQVKIVLDANDEGTVEKTVEEIKKDSKKEFTAYKANHDAMVNYLTKVMEEFKWSTKVMRETGEVQSKLIADYADLEKKWSDFWQKVDERRIAAADRREQKADETEKRALQIEREAREKAKQQAMSSVEEHAEFLRMTRIMREKVKQAEGKLEELREREKELTDANSRLEQELQRLRAESNQ
mmetsp:Transcript_23298/g.53672  ORF Transcript_23298/g.53672 Transcript_23298/m.53672 type:complete len:1232 (-) Transcript_23298:110-3805(-)